MITCIKPCYIIGRLYFYINNDFAKPHCECVLFSSATVEPFKLTLNVTLKRALWQLPFTFIVNYNPFLRGLSTGIQIKKVSDLVRSYSAFMQSFLNTKTISNVDFHCNKHCMFDIILSIVRIQNPNHSTPHFYYDSFIRLINAQVYPDAEEQRNTSCYH